MDDLGIGRRDAGAGMPMADLASGMMPPPSTMFDLSLPTMADGAAGCPHEGNDPLKTIYDAVTDAQLTALLKQLSGGTPVDIGGKMVSLTDRYLPASKTNWRAFAMKYFMALGLNPVEQPYKTAHSIGETDGHNIEIVLPGASPDSVAIVIHYDSMGPAGEESQNPGVDDNMTGMAAAFEAARQFVNPCYKLAYTVRFAFLDYEEHANPKLEGPRKYAEYLQALSKEKGFKIVSAIDYEQSGWNCKIDQDACRGETGGTVFYIGSCSGSEDGSKFDYPMIGDEFEALAKKYSKLAVKRICIAEHSDHYAMWEIGVPAVVSSEFGDNPRFDNRGGDTFDRIDTVYHAEISRTAIAYTAKLVGLSFR